MHRAPDAHERVAEALGLLYSGKVIGKVVLVPVLPAEGDRKEGRTVA